MNSPFDYVDLDLDHVDTATLEREGSVHVKRASRGRGFMAVSRASSDTRYHVDLLCDNSGYCDCPDFVYRKARQGMPCKHIVALEMHIEMSGRGSA